LQCAKSGVPEDASNLVYRAADLFLRATAGRRQTAWGGVGITLQKNIPVAAGLGGGSSDAAATLLGMNQLLGGGLSDEELAGLGVQLGADVPFFLAPEPSMLATGIGEVLQAAPPLGQCWILLVNPGFSVSTRWVYQNFALTDAPGPGIFANSRDELAPLAADNSTVTLVNDLERVTLEKYPELSCLKDALRERGSIGTLMSGSGPTIFAIFQDQQLAQAAYAYFQRQYARSFLVDPERAS